VRKYETFSSVTAHGRFVREFPRFSDSPCTLHIRFRGVNNYGKSKNVICSTYGNERVSGTHLGAK